jgi:hypothetical protein
VNLRDREGHSQMCAASHKFSEFLNMIGLEPRDQAEIVIGRHMEPTRLRGAILGGSLVGVVESVGPELCSPGFDAPRKSNLAILQLHLQGCLRFRTVDQRHAGEAIERPRHRSESEGVSAPLFRRRPCSSLIAI